MPQNNDPYSIIHWLLGLGMAFLGAIAKIAYDISCDKPMGIKLALCKLIVSMFAGALTTLLSSILGFSHELAGCMGGSAGWLGAEMIGAIANKMKNNVGK